MRARSDCTIGLPTTRRVAVLQKHRGAAPVGAQAIQVLAGEVAVMRRRAVAVARVTDRLGEQVAPLQPSVIAVHHAEPGDQPRHRDRHRPGARDAGGIALRGRGIRRRSRAVDDRGAPARGVEDRIKPVAAETRHHRLDDRERQRGRDRRVDRVAALAQRQQPGLRRQRMVGRDGAAPPDDQRPIAANVVHVGFSRCSAA